MLEWDVYNQVCEKKSRKWNTYIRCIELNEYYGIEKYMERKAFDEVLGGIMLIV